MAHAHGALRLAFDKHESCKTGMAVTRAVKGHQNADYKILIVEALAEA